VSYIWWKSYNFSKLLAITQIKELQSNKTFDASRNGNNIIPC
jgi:hypothetical protein